MNILIKNALVLPMTAAAGEEKKYYRGSVGIAGNRIAFAGDDPQRERAFEAEHEGTLKIVDGSGMLVMPGLINLHNHVSMSLMRGYADDMALMPWLTEKIWPFEALLTGDDIYMGAQLGIAEMLLGGTTTFVDMYWHADRVSDAVLDSGIRAVVCPTFFDSAYDAFAAEAPRIIETYDGAGNGRLGIRIAPHAPYSCSPEHIRGALAICSRYGIGLHTHLSETQDENRIIRERYGKTPTQYYRDLGMFDHPTLAVHCVHMTDDDLDILQRHGVSVGHNPQSNMKLASGIAPVAEMLRRGMNVGIGTDGPCSNNDLDMWDELRTASLLQKVATGDPCALPAYETMQMATVNGARALGREGELGIVAEGALADVILVRLDAPHMNPCHDLIANLAYSAKSTDVDTVIVDGEVRVEGGRVEGTDTAGLGRRATKCVEEIIKRKK